jgi:hypothetical protein
MHHDRLDQALGAVGVRLPFGSENQLAGEMLAGEPPDRFGRDVRETRIEKARLADALGQMDRARKLERRLDVITERAEFGVGRTAVGWSQSDSDGAFPIGKEIDVAAGRQMQELDIIAPLHRRRMVRAAPAGVKTPRRQCEPQLSIQRLARVEIADADHQMIDAVH